MMPDTINRNDAIETILKETTFRDIQSLMKYAENPIRARGWIGGLADCIKILQNLKPCTDKEDGEK